jgi:hypothetical protein
MNKLADVTSPKVLTPAILFGILSSGMVFFIKKNGGNTFGSVLLVNALVFALLYFLITKYILKRSLTRADIVVPLVLYIALTPGVLLTIPPGAKGLFMSGETSGAAVAVHTLVFALVFSLLRGAFPQYY